MDVAAQIVRRRKQLLVHRYVYYVCGESLVTDLQYDTWERELKELVATNPAIAESASYSDDCPAKQVGSSNLWDYPRELQHVGDSLIAFVERWPFGYFDDTPDSETEQPEMF